MNTFFFESKTGLPLKYDTGLILLKNNRLNNLLKGINYRDCSECGQWW